MYVLIRIATTLIPRQTPFLYLYSIFQKPHYFAHLHNIIVKPPCEIFPGLFDRWKQWWASQESASLFLKKNNLKIPFLTKSRLHNYFSGRGSQFELITKPLKNLPYLKPSFPSSLTPRCYSGRSALLIFGNSGLKHNLFPLKGFILVFVNWIQRKCLTHQSKCNWTREKACKCCKTYNSSIKTSTFYYKKVEISSYKKITCILEFVDLYLYLVSAICHILVCQSQLLVQSSGPEVQF